MSSRLKLHIVELIGFMIFFTAYFILLTPLLIFEFISVTHIITLTLILIAIGVMYGSIKTWWKYRNICTSEDELPYLHERLEDLSNKMKCKKPRLVILDTQTPNAYATDALPTRPIVILTTGLLDTLNRNEIDAVIAHEISHIKSYDVFFMMFLSTVMSFVRRKHNFTRQFVFGGDAFGTIVFIIPFIITRINLTICRFNFFLISRVREYVADNDASEVTSSIDMKNALIKINNRMHELQKMNANQFYGEEALCIVPFTVDKKKLFSTHPSLEDRIKNLENK